MAELTNSWPDKRVFEISNALTDAQIESTQSLWLPQVLYAIYKCSMRGDLQTVLQDGLCSQSSGINSEKLGPMRGLGAPAGRWWVEGIQDVVYDRRLLDMVRTRKYEGPMMSRTRGPYQKIA